MSRQFKSTDTSPWPYGFGSGVDGDLAISADTAETVINSSCSGTAGTNSLSATNAGFQAGQIIWIHKTRGMTTTAAGSWEINYIAGYTAGTITTALPLQNSYNDSGNDQSQVRVMKQYNNVTVDSTKNFTSTSWDGNIGGLFGFFVKGTLTNNGIIKSNGGNGAGAGAGAAAGGTGGGFRGGDGYVMTGYPTQALCGENSTSASAAAGATGSGGGGAYQSSEGSGGEGGGGGGGHSETGWYAGHGGSVGSGNGGGGGGTDGVAALTTMVFGGGGGGGLCKSGNTVGGGGSSGGIIFIVASNIVNAGTISANGGNGGSGVPWRFGGGGAGGSILLKCKTATLGSAIITATKGVGYAASPDGANSGSGSPGRIHLDYKISYTGTTNPAVDVTNDLTLDYPAGGSFLFNFL